MRFPVFILALIVSGTACAQTPLPRQRPADAPARAAAKTQDVSKSNTSTPLPRSRPAERRVEVALPAPIAPVKKPAAETPSVESAVTALPPETPVQEVPPVKEAVSVQQTNPVPQETGVQESTRFAETSPVKAPATRFKPEVVIKRARAEAAAIEAAEAEEAASRHAEKAQEDKEDKDQAATPPEQDKEFANAQLAEPKQAENKQAEEKQGESEPAPAANEDSALPEQPAMQKRAGPPKISSGAVPVSPSEAARLDRLEAQRKTAPREDGPATMATITPEELNKLIQTQQGLPAVSALFKKVPSPKKRPVSAWPRPDDMDFRDVIGKSPDEECDAVVNSGIIVAERIPALGRWGACYVPHAVRVNAIMLMGRQRVDIVPPAKLRCGMALAVANWVRGEVAPAAASLGAKFVGIRQLDSYNCRTMSSTKRLMSEHSAGNALDVAELMLANHDSAPLYSRTTQKALRSKLKATACRRFKTVLGPGVPQHHDHIHIDLRHHHSGNGICHWNVL